MPYDTEDVSQDVGKVQQSSSSESELPPITIQPSDNEGRLTDTLRQRRPESKVQNGTGRRWPRSIGVLFAMILAVAAFCARPESLPPPPPPPPPVTPTTVAPQPIMLAKIGVPRYWICDCTDEITQVKVQLSITNLDLESLDIGMSSAPTVRLILGPYGRTEVLTSKWVPAPASQKYSLAAFGNLGKVVALSPNLPGRSANPGTGEYVSVWSGTALSAGETYFREVIKETPLGPRGSDLVFNIPPGEYDNILGVGIVVSDQVVGFERIDDWVEITHGMDF